MPMLDFVRANARWLAAGALLSFCSSFGQTFFIALSGPELRAELGLSHGGWGGVYTAGTVAAALTLNLIGPLADRFRVRALAAGTLMALAAACVGMSATTGVIALGLTVFALRLLGQGFSSHLAIVAMGRWFSAQRGRALAISALGFSLGEALLPTAAVALQTVAGWRGVWIAAAAFLLATIPAMLWLLAKERTPKAASEENPAPGVGGRHWTRREALGHWLFWALTPGLFGPPFIGTTIFFQQAHVAEVKGWSLATVAAAFPLYAGATIATSFVAAWATDRFGARRLLPLYQAPMALGALLLASFDAPATVFVAYALCGVTQGGAMAVLGALWPEVYGTRWIGAIRAAAMSMLVVATALGPGVSGALIDVGIGVETQFAAMAAWAGATCLFYAGLAARIRAAMATAEA